MKPFTPALALCLTFSTVAAAQTQDELIALFNKSPINQVAKKVEAGEFMVPGNSVDNVSFHFMAFTQEKDAQTKDRVRGVYCKAVAMAEENRANASDVLVDMQTYVNDVAIARVLKAGRNSMGFTPAICTLIS